MKNFQLKPKQRFLVGLTLFGMFFGAGNLIFPIHLGQLSGSNAWISILGFCIPAVSIPIMGVAAIGHTHSDGLQMLATKVGKGYGYFFTCLLYLTIGPFFAIPRCATVSFTTGIAPMVGEDRGTMALIIFSIVFFAITLLCSLKPGKITVWIGKIINPIFLIFLAILVVTALVRSGMDVSGITPDYDYEISPFFSSIIEGYGTMDAIAGLAFGIVVVDIIRSMGVEDDRKVSREVLASGLMAGLFMALIYIFTIIVGAKSREFAEISENGGIALNQIARYYLGDFGAVVLAITITFACLKTAIGLVTSCAEAFRKMFPKALPYWAWAVIFSVFSFLISNVGLSAIINYSVPVLMFLYPQAITLILLALFGHYFKHDRRIYIWVMALTMLAAIFDLVRTLPAELLENSFLQGMVQFATKVLPFYELNLGWVIPAFIGFLCGLVHHFIAKAVRKK